MFFKKGKGALWVCVWNQGGGGPKKFGNHCTRRTVLRRLPHMCITAQCVHVLILVLTFPNIATESKTRQNEAFFP
jgi:hypothetical protein